MYANTKRDVLGTRVERVCSRCVTTSSRHGLPCKQQLVTGTKRDTRATISYSFKLSYVVLRAVQLSNLHANVSLLWPTGMCGEQAVRCDLRRPAHSAVTRNYQAKQRRSVAALSGQPGAGFDRHFERTKRGTPC